MKKAKQERKNGVTIAPWKGHKIYKWRVSYPEEGKRKSKGYRTKGEAKEAAEKFRGNITEHGNKHADITDAERAAVHAFRKLAANLPEAHSQRTLSDVVNDYAEKLQRTFTALTFSQVADKLLIRLRTEHKSQAHISALLYRLKPFTAEYGDWMASDISTEIIDEYLTNLKLAAQTKLHRRRALFQVFQYAIQLNATDSNPVREALTPTVIKSEAGILSPRDLSKLLNAADERTTPALAISFFAGIRRAELERLDWSEIDFEENEIEIKASKAKTAQRRFIPMSDNLKAWLMPYAKHEGKIVASPAIYRKGMEQARSIAGIPFPHNAGRHSFASYHLALNDDAGKTAAALGHQNSTLLYSRYRALVKRKQAEAYWSITPVKGQHITNIKSA